MTDHDELTALLAALDTFAAEWKDGVVRDVAYEAAAAIRRLQAEVDQWATTSDEAEGSLQSIKGILGGPDTEGAVWSAQRVVDERDQLRADVAALVPAARAWFSGNDYWPGLLAEESAARAVLDRLAKEEAE